MHLYLVVLLTYSCILIFFRKVILTGELLNPISLTVLGNYIYWIDNDQQIIEMANKITGLEKQRVQARIPLLTKILAVNAGDPEQYVSHPCAVKNGGCSHLCLLNEEGKRRCACPLDLVLSSDRISCMEIPECPADKFRCYSGVTCFPMNWRCDGIAECDDMSDEMNCPECKPHQFRCQNGDCIDAKYKCDGTPHCKDESDEQCCQKNSFLCSSFECISQSQVCDSKKDCSDGSDENSGNCAIVTSHQHANQSPNQIYIILFSCLALFGIISVAFYRSGPCRLFCKKKLPSKDEDIRDVMLPSSRSGIDHYSTVSSGQRDIAVSSFQGSSHLLDSMPTSASSMYDRNHVTGASSSSSSRTYPLATKAPYPSPVSVRAPQLRSSYKQMEASGHSYKYRNRSKPHPPPPHPTPCSTDVCDDSEHSYYCSSGVEFDSDPFILPTPPPSPPPAPPPSPNTCQL